MLLCSKNPASLANTSNFSAYGLKKLFPIRSKLYPDNGDGHDSYNEDIVVIVANNKIIRLKE